MAQRRYCKTCKVAFVGAECPARHKPIMYTDAAPAPAFNAAVDMFGEDEDMA